MILSNQALCSSCCGNNINLENIQPSPEIEDGFHVETISQIIINKNPAEIKSWFDRVAPEKIIHGTKDVAGIAGTKIISNIEWGKSDSMRLVCYANNKTSLEKILENVPGRIFKYQLWDFTDDITHAIKYAVSEFKVQPIDKHKSLLIWNFAFRPNAYIFRIPLSLYAKKSFKEYMDQSLIDIKKYIES